MADQKGGGGVVGVDAGPSKEVLALASEVFDRFCAANTLRTILSLHRHLCDLLRIKPTNFPQFYPKIRGRLRSWKAEAIWAKLEKRASHKCYSRGRACPNTRMFVIGAGPCGLRTAIEAQLLGAKVVVVEKRDRISRNNVLHLWPFVIHDLRALGAKKFFGKFCAGSIDHISIRQLQCILLKVALLLGVEVHVGISFEGLRPPPEDQSERIGWRADVLPADHPVSQYEFDVLVGADGKRNTLEGFKRKEFRGKLAIAITVNFINKHTEAEARVQEISGVAFIFRQKFFQEMRASTGIDLENIVYYKDETHYFVMTAKKHSLLAKGVILQDYANTAKLLSPENVDREALLDYAREAADFATEGKLPHLEPAVNHHNQPDVAMFDFTSLYAAENASRVVERRGHRLLMLLVGDSLTEPFWPTGSGCARGFLSSMNACWAVRSWGQLGPPSIQLSIPATPPTSLMIESSDEHVTNGDGNKENEKEGDGLTTPTNKTPTTPNSPAPKRSVYAVLEVLAERESLYRLLGQVAPDNMSRDFDGYTLDPRTRYLILNNQSVLPYQVRSLFDTDDRSALSFDPPVGPVPGLSDHPKRRRKRDTQVHPDMLLQWLKRQVALYDGVTVEDMTRSFKDGLALCAVIHRYRPDLLDFHSLNPNEVAHNNQLAFDTLEREHGIPPVMTGLEMEQCDVPDKLTMLTYLSQVYDTFRGEIPHIKHPKLQDDVDFLAEEAAAAAEAAALQQARLRKLGSLSQTQKASLITRIVSTSTGKAIPHPLVAYAKRNAPSSSPSTAASPASVADRSLGEPSSASLRRMRKRRSSDKAFGTLSAERMKLQEELANNRLERQRKRQYQRKLATQRFHKSLAMLQANARRPAGSDDEAPFQDLSILFYRMTAPSFEDRVRDLETKILYPDREARMQAELRKGRNNKGGVDEDFSGRVKNIEDKLKGNAPVEKRPKDLLRAIGKIEKSDWNVREIEKKMAENKMGKGRHSKAERVPKWNQEKFQDKFMAVERKLRGKGADQEGQDKYAEIDRSLKHYERKIKEGIALDPTGPRGSNKVSAMAEQFSAKPKDPADVKVEEVAADQGTSLQRSNSRGALVVVPQGGSETCHFCGKRVYLMERLSAEGCFFHRGCFRCEYCSTTLRLGNYAFDRDGKYGSRFFCVQHFGLQGLLNGAVRIGSKAGGKSGGGAGGGTKERHARGRRSGRDGGVQEVRVDDGTGAEEKENAIQLPANAPKGKSPGTGTAGRKSTGEGKRRSKGSGNKYASPRICSAPVVDPVPFLSPPYIPDEEVDLADRGTTPERIEFENTSIPLIASESRNSDYGGKESGKKSTTGDGEPSKKVSSVEELPQMDEDEWINRNFGASAAEDASDDDDDDSSSFSNDEADENVEVRGIADLGGEVTERRRHSHKKEEKDRDVDEVFEEAMEEPLMTAEQTRILTEKWKRRYSKDVVEDDGGPANKDAQNGKADKDDEDDSSDTYESGDSEDYDDEDEDEEDSETATEGDEEEGEEEAKARELRKQEFHLKVPVRPPRTSQGSGGDQGSDTEVNSEDYSTSTETDSDDDDDDDEEEDEENSATEISTDSEFDDDRHRANFHQHEIPTIVIDESLLCSGINGDIKIEGLDSNKPKDSTSPQQQPRPSPRFIPLSRTHSTEGIASKVSLELKKRYLLGGTAEPSPPAISTTARRSILGTPAVPPAPALDSKLRCLADAISEHQKLLHPAPEPSATMQTFLQKSSSTTDANHHHITQTTPMTLQKDIDSIRKRLLSDYAAKTPAISALSLKKVESKEIDIGKGGSGDYKSPLVLTPREPGDVIIVGKGEEDGVLSSSGKYVNGLCSKGNLDLTLRSGVTKSDEVIKSPPKSYSNGFPKEPSSPPKIVGEIQKISSNSSSFVERDIKKNGGEVNAAESPNVTGNAVMRKPSSDISSSAFTIVEPVEVKKVMIETIEDEEEQLDSKGEWVDCRPRSPVHETSIEVPEVNWSKVRAVGIGEDDMDDEEDSMSEDSLQDDYDDEKDIDEAEIIEKVMPVPPVVVVEETPADDVETVDLVIMPDVIISDEVVPVKMSYEHGKDSAEITQGLEENLKERMEKPKESLISEEDKDVIVELSHEADQIVSEKVADSKVSDNEPVVSVAYNEEVNSGQIMKVDVKSESRKHLENLPLKKPEELPRALDDEDVPTPTETEELSSDWARDTDAANSVGEDLDLELCVNPIYVNTCDRRRRDKIRKRIGKIHKKIVDNSQWTPSAVVRKAEVEDDFTGEPSVSISTHLASAPPPLPSAPPPPLQQQVQSNSYCPEDIEFMDVGTEGSSPDDERDEVHKKQRRRKGYTQLTEGDRVTADVEDEGEVTPVAEDEDDDDDDTSSDTVSGVRRSRTVEAVNCIAIGLAEEEEDGFSPAQDDTTTPSDAVTTVIESHASLSADTEEAEEEDGLGGLDVRPHREDEQDVEYQGHVRRLKGRVSPFSNARDSIDIRKSRKQQKSGRDIGKIEAISGHEEEDEKVLVASPESPSFLEKEIILVEKLTTVETPFPVSSSANVSVPSSSIFTSPDQNRDSSVLSLSPTSNATPITSSEPPTSKLVPVSNPTIIRPFVNSPSTSRKLEELSRERSKQKDLIREMVIARLGSSEGGCRRSSSSVGGDRRRGRSPRSSSSGPGSPDLTTSPTVSILHTKEAAPSPISPLASPLPKSPEKSETKCTPRLTPTRSLSLSPNAPPPALSNLRARMMQRRHSLHSEEPLTVETESSMDKVFSTPSNVMSSTPIGEMGGKATRPLSVHSTSRALSSSTVGLGGILPDTPLTNPDAFSMPDIRRALFRTPLASGAKDSSGDVPVRPIRRKETPSSEKSSVISGNTDSNEVKTFETKSDSTETGVNAHEGVKPRPGLGEERGIDVVLHSLGREVVDVIPKEQASSLPTSPARQAGTAESPKLEVDVKEGEKVVLRKDGKKGSKDRERRKSIIQAVSDFFGGKKTSASSGSTTASSSTPSSPPPAALLTSPSPTSSVASPTHSVGKDKVGGDKFPRFPRLHPRSKGYKLGKSSSSEFESDSDGYDEKDKKISLSERGLASSSEKDLTFRSSSLAEKSKADSQRLTSSEYALPPLTIPPSTCSPVCPAAVVSEKIAPRATEESFSEGEVGRGERLSSAGTAVSTPSHETPSGGSSMESSASALPLLGGKQSRQARRKARQAQLQRLRMAQEIQRQLEELEVKQRLLEKRGVSVEKALRGEEKGGPLEKMRMESLPVRDDDIEDDDDDDDEDDDDGDGEEEAKLLQEWFELMRERSELRRCERELLVRAEELSLEDRHARLQADLRDRLARDDSTKSKSDVAREGEILGEMLEIVERRDSLIALLEEDRQRYRDEDRDLESQMLAKGLRLSPIRKESHV